MLTTTPTDTAPQRPPTRRRAGWFLGAGAVLAGSALSLWRQPGAGALDTIWAEDGAIFLASAAGPAPAAALVTSYAGYLHTIPRLLAPLAALATPGAAAGVLAVTAAVTTALLAVLVYVASADHLTGRLSRFLAAAVVVAVPVGQEEVFNSIANLHWPGLYVMFWLLLWAPRGRVGRGIATGVVLLVALSDILVLVFVPLALWNAVRRRDPHRIMLAAALGVGLAMQVLGLVAGTSSRALTPDPVLAATGFVARAVPAGLVGERWLGTELTAASVVPIAAAWLLVAAVALIAWLRATRPAWTLALLAAGHAAAVYALPVLLSGVATPRYAAAPAMLMVTALIALVRPGEAVPGRAPIYALAALLAVVWVVNLRMDNTRADGPRWSDEVRAAQARCATQAGDTAVELRISPVEPVSWYARLPCGYVRRG